MHVRMHICMYVCINVGVYIEMSLCDKGVLVCVREEDKDRMTKREGMCVFVRECVCVCVWCVCVCVCLPVCAYMNASSHAYECVVSHI